MRSLKYPFPQEVCFCTSRGGPGWRHRLNGHEFEQAPGDSEGQGSLACCSTQGCKESDMTEGRNKKFNTKH